MTVICIVLIIFGLQAFGALSGAILRSRRKAPDAKSPWHVINSMSFQIPVLRRLSLKYWTTIDEPWFWIHVALLLFWALVAFMTAMIQVSLEYMAFLKKRDQERVGE